MPSQLAEAGQEIDKGIGLHVMGGHGLVEEHSLQVLPHLLGKIFVLVLLEV